jgi:hypothetical protein
MLLPPVLIYCTKKRTSSADQQQLIRFFTPRLQAATAATAQARLIILKLLFLIGLA